MAAPLVSKGGHLGLLKKIYINNYFKLICFVYLQKVIGQLDIRISRI